MEEEKVNSCKKSGKILPIISAIVAVGGLGFGGFELWQNIQKDSKIGDLEGQLSSKNNEVVVDTPEITEEANNVEAKSGPYIDEGYFFVPKWGVKYKLSDELTNYGYAVDQDNEADSYSGDRYVVGLTAEKNPAQSRIVKNENDIFGCSTVTIRKTNDEIQDKTSDVEFLWTKNFEGQKFVIHDIWKWSDCDYGVQHGHTPSEESNEIAKKIGQIFMNPEKM